MNIYVGNLARTVTEDDLRKVFAEKGAVDKVKIVIDRDTNQPRGFGFVDMPNAEEAQRAIAELDKKYELHGSVLKVNEARPPENRAPRYGNGGGGFGGNRSSGGFGGSRGGDRGGNGGWGSRPR